MVRRKSWRARSTSPKFARWWAPWYTLNPLRGRGRRINERRSVGLRDLVAAPSEVRNRPDVRWRVIGGAFAVMLGLLVTRLFFLQVVDHEVSLAAAKNNALRTSVIPASRGEIRDRTGITLVGNVTTTELRLSYAEALLHPDVKGALAELTGKSNAELDRILGDLRYDRYQPIPILLDTPANLIEYLTLHQSEFPGVSLVRVSHRVYPLGGGVAPHLLGYVGPINGDELASRPNMGYQMDSKIGKAGIESFYETYLRGIDGKRTLRVDRRGNILDTVNTSSAQVGNSLVLNVDAGLQKALDGYLEASILRTRRTIDGRSGVYPPAPNGAAVVLDPTNGHVLAMSSYPSYDLSQFVTGLSSKTFQSLMSTGAFNNFAIQGQYTPGSTFKLISATAMLQTGIQSASKVMNDKGTYRVPGCLQGYHGCIFHGDEAAGSGYVNLSRALTVSSDVYFYQLGYLFWSQTGRYGLTPIQDVASNYGLDSPTQIDLPDENVGRVDSPTVRKALHAEAPKAFPNVDWFTGDNLQMAFGQGSTAVTPLEMANAFATFANGGTRYAPEVVSAVVDAHGKVIQSYGPKVLGHISLPERIRGPILQGLLGVVSSPEGTANYPFMHYAHFSLRAFPVAGKTGTASNSPGQEPNAWFVAFGPVPNPKYVVLCVIGKGGYGASAAAPVVAQAFDYLVAHPIKPVHIAPAIITTGR